MALRVKKTTTICKFCRTEFETRGFNKVCPSCEIGMDGYFKSIKEYLQEHPHATAAQICDELHMPLALIKYFLREDRLEIIGGDASFFTCEICHKPISSGRYCPTCEAKSLREDMKAYLVKSHEETEMERQVAHFHTARRLVE